MSEQDEKTSVRRLGRKDRKRRLDPRGPLFPPEEMIPPSAPVEIPVEPEPDSAPPEEKAPPVQPVPERFPPLDFDTQEKPAAAPQPAPIRRRSTCLPNLITLIFAVATIVVIAVFAVIAANPYTPLNPFPPFTPLPIIVTATFLPPTDAPPPTAGPTPTFTPIPLDTQGQPLPNYTFTLSNNAPVYIPNANDQACNWSSIAGSVTDASGSALNGYGIHITGDGVDSVVFSGAALTFGPGGFELFLNGTPQEKTYSVQLLSPQGVVLSDTYSISTQSNCDQNVAILTFVQTDA